MSRCSTLLIPPSDVIGGGVGPPGPAGAPGGPGPAGPGWAWEIAVPGGGGAIPVDASGTANVGDGLFAPGAYSLAGPGNDTQLGKTIHVVSTAVFGHGSVLTVTNLVGGGTITLATNDNIVLAAAPHVANPGVLWWYVVGGSGVVS